MRLAKSLSSGVGRGKQTCPLAAGKQLREKLANGTPGNRLYRARPARYPDKRGLGALGSFPRALAEFLPISQSRPSRGCWLAASRQRCRGPRQPAHHRAPRLISCPGDRKFPRKTMRESRRAASPMRRSSREAPARTKGEIGVRSSTY